MIVVVGAIVGYMLWWGDQIIEEKTITVTITDIDYNYVYGGGSHYQLTFSDGSWMKISSLYIVESSLKENHTYRLSLIHKRSSGWLIINVTEVSTP